VNWYPWGEEAFSEARKRDVPIFLSSNFSLISLWFGYSTCHWCHVMEVESFEDEGVAKVLNDGFISIKASLLIEKNVQMLIRVIFCCQVYMTYVQALYGGGGWPLSVFLSPDLKPLMGGTYFPPDDKYGRPGFKTVLRKVKEAWKSKRDVLVSSGAFAIEQLSEALSASSMSTKLPEGLPQKALHRGAKQLAESFDLEFGGFGSAPKFPRPVESQLMLYNSKRLVEDGKPSEAKDGLKMVLFTLQCMAKGGIHDHVGGGFHRYSVDECWHVPHFEKMLYDQGQLANVYLDVFSITRDAFYSCVARDILDYLIRDMLGPNGEIFSAEDADSAESEGATRKKEGAFYIWTSKELEDIVGEHATLFEDHYYIKPLGNCDLSTMSDPHNEFKGKNVLIERNSTTAMASKFGMPVENYLEILGSCRRKLFEVRSRRPKPHLDDKVIVSWNGLAVSSFARASKILKSEPVETMFNFPVVGTADELFLDKEGGGYFNTPGEDPSVLLRVKEDHDGAEPSGNSVSVINLVRLASMVAGNRSDRYRQNAEHLLTVFKKRLEDAAIAVPLMCCAADMLSVPSRKQVVLVGHKPSVELEDMLAAAHASYDPNRTVIHIDPTDTEELEFWEQNNPNIALMAKNNFASEKVVALVCQNFTCSSPVADRKSLETLLSRDLLSAV
ncbi:hypothetical protein RJ639_000432, partial [Escallonia herrerae]